MKRTKIATLALIGIMAIGGVGVTAFAQEVESMQREATVKTAKFSGGTASSLKAAKEQGLTVSDLKEIKANLDEKGISIKDAKAKKESMELSGLTAKGLKDVKANLDEKGLTLAEAKTNFAGMLENLAQTREITTEEAKSKIQEMKEKDMTLEGVKKLKNRFGNNTAE